MVKSASTQMKVLNIMTITRFYAGHFIPVSLLFIFCTFLFSGNLIMRLRVIAFLLIYTSQKFFSLLMVSVSSVCFFLLIIRIDVLIGYC